MSTNRAHKLTTKYDRPAIYHERLREKIQVGKIVDRVQKCALGQVEMTSTQFQAAKLLINKTIPDLPVETHVTGNVKDISHQSPYDLLTIIEGQAERVKSDT